MKEFIAVAKVVWYNESEENPEDREITDYIVITNVQTFAEVMTQIEEYYGCDLIKAEVELLEGPFLHVKEDWFNAIEKDIHLNE